MFEGLNRRLFISLISTSDDFPLFRKDIFLPEVPFAKERVRLKIKNPITKTVIINPHFNNDNTKGDISIIAKIEISVTSDI